MSLPSTSYEPIQSLPSAEVISPSTSNHQIDQMLPLDVGSTLPPIGSPASLSVGLSEPVGGSLQILSGSRQIVSPSHRRKRVRATAAHAIYGHVEGVCRGTAPHCKLTYFSHGQDLNLTTTRTFLSNTSRASIAREN